MMNIRFLLPVIISLCTNGVLAQPRSYTVANAHAHNDYIHALPFGTAYEAGFGSIEVDVFLRNNQLFVAHDTASINTSRTIEALYFNPLRQAIKANNGYAYKDSLKKLLLLVDLKTAALPTLNKLISILQQYKELTGCPTLQIVITGNQPNAQQLTTYPPYIYFDGNLMKYYTLAALNKIALFSDNLNDYTKWKGAGLLPVPDRNKIKTAITNAHDLHKPIRFWGAPDAPNAWSQLMQLDADYINTDKIAEISAYFKKLSENTLSKQ